MLREATSGSRTLMHQREPSLEYCSIVPLLGRIQLLAVQCSACGASSLARA